VTAGGSSIAEVQRLLAMLAVGRHCAEAGTAYGEGAAAMAGTATSLVTVERDPERAALARDRLRAYANVELVVGDWRRELPPRGPFDLLFLDSGGFKQAPRAVGQLALKLLVPGSVLVVDDLTPGLVDHDPARAFLLEHPELVGTEVLTTPRTSAIVAIRREGGNVERSTAVVSPHAP
jgi:predicted O-methyltransferase YrrM